MNLEGTHPYLRILTHRYGKSGLTAGFAHAIHTLNVARVEPRIQTGAICPSLALLALSGDPTLFNEKSTELVCILGSATSKEK